MFKSLKLFFLIIGSLFIFNIAASAADAPKIAVVDFQKVVTNSEKGKAADANLKKEADKIRQELNIDKQSAELEKMNEEFKKESAVLSKEKLQEKGKQLNEKIRKFQGAQKEYNKKAGELHQKLAIELHQNILNVVEEIGKKEGYTLIIEKSGVLYSESTDITDQVIKKCNALK